MKGKVTCPNCGWSWNKSDSSVKDMHVCHNCGKSDVNMKTGGWLDNYNDSTTSAPEGFQGEGYSMKGRDYSPAWGGQFQMGGSVYPVNYVPKAQLGLPVSPIMPLAGAVANKLNDWFGDDEPVKKKAAPKKAAPKKPTDRNLAIVDPRKKMATTNQPLRPNSDLVSGKYNSKHLDRLLQEAKRQGLSKKDMLDLSAMGFQETKWGRSDGNIGHVIGDWEGDDSYQQFISAYKAKMKEADRLGIKDPAMRLQVYNGLGTITPKTEKDYHGFEMQKIYGVPIPKGGINMKKNPLYGKQVMDIRDNVLAKNPEYVKYMDSIYKAPLPKYMQEEARMNKQKPPANMRKSSSLSIPSLVAPKKKKQDGDSIPQAQDGNKLNPFTYPRPDYNYNTNPFLVRDPQHNIFISGVNPTYSTKDFSIGASMVGVGNKDFQKIPADYGIRGSYNPTDSLSINASISKNNVGAGLRYRFQMGGSLPGATGSMYARTGAPSNGPYAKKTMASAKNGDVIVSDRGQWDYPGEITQIDQSKEGSYIDMGPDPETGKPITQNVLAVSDTGDVKLMMPGGKYKLNGTKVTEYPVAQTGTTTGKKLNLPDGKAFLEKLKAESAARDDWRNVREVPRTVVNDNIPNAHDMAVKADAALVKQQKYEQKVKADQAKAQADAQKKFNALPKKEQERILYDQRNQQYGSISQYEPEGFWEKAGNIALAPFTALREKMETGHVPDNLVKGIVNDPKNVLNPMDVAYLGTLGYAASPYVSQAVATATPYMALDATVGGTTLTGVNLNNLITAGFATHGLTNIGPDAAEWAENPSWEKAGELGMDALEIAPIVGPGAKMLGEGAGYVKSKANQALAKTNEVLAPRLDKARTLANDMSAVISGEKKTIGPKIDAINDAESALYQSQEYTNYASENLKIRQQKWALEGKLNQMKGKASLAEINELNDKINHLQKRINVAEQFTLNGEGLVQSGKNTSLGLRTGSTDIMDLSTGEMFPISTSVPNESIIHTIEGDKVVKTVNNTSLPQASPEYGATVKKNIDFIETQIPGAKVFGSAKNVAETEIPHIVGDYDVLMSQTQYEKFAKANPSVGNNGFAELHNIPGAAKGVDPIDINVIQEKGGKAIGVRAEELFKQVAPDEYYTAAKKAIKSKSEIKIPYSSQQLVDMTNPTTKSVVDAYESTKDKHLNKIDALINFGKPSVVAEGQQQFVNSLVGSKGSIGHQFPVEQLSNAEANAEILDKIGFIGNKKLVAADPERMQLAINDYYMNNSILTRQVDRSKVNTIEKAIKEYYPGAGGGNVNGIGQNHVMLGHPFHGDGNVVSMKQLGMNLDTKDPMSYINSIEHNVSAEKLFNEDERKILADIIDNIKMDDRFKHTANQSENTAQLIENLPYSEEGKKALYEFAKQTGRTIAKKDSQYGNSTYASTLRDFDEAIDIMQYQVANSRNAMKSYRQRSDAAQYAANSTPTISPDIELLPKQFKAIKGYVEGGMERAKERLDALSKQKRKISEDIDALADKAYNKKFKEELDRLKEFRDKIDKEADEMAKMRRDLYDRKIHLNNLEDKMKTVGILGGGGATLAGIGTFAYKQDQQQRKEFDERLKKMTKEERKQFDKDLEERIRKADSLDRIDKPSSAKFMDWFMGRKQNGGSITKAKDGNQLVKLDQLTNFTNYNTKQPGGWLDTL